MSDPTGKVEQIARLINPSRWRVLDSYLAEMVRRHRGEAMAYDPDIFMDKASLALAEQIVSLVADTRAEGSRQLQDLLHEAQQRNAELREALKPFADAADSADVPGVLGRSPAWESPMAMAVTYQDFRRAQAALKSAPERSHNADI